jgi:hypothetical protein
MEKSIIVEPVNASILATLTHQVLPTATYPRQLVRLYYGEEDFSSYVISLTFEGTSAHITCEIPLSYANRHDRSAPLQHLWGQPLRGDTDVGEQFDARSAYGTGFSVTSGPGFEGSGYRLTITSDHWCLTRTPPLLWAGQLDGDLPEGPGNLNLQIGTLEDGYSSSTAHFGLRGAKWTYYLLKKERRGPHHTLVVDTAGQTLDYGLLHSELRILSYCVGQPLRCGLLVGLAAGGETVAYLGGTYGYSRLQANYEMTPVPREVFQPWFTLLFQRLTSYLHEKSPAAREEMLHEAITLSVEAAAEINNTSREVKALLACLALARWFVGSEVSLVHSPTKWDRWVRDSRPLHQHAGPGHELLLQARVEKAALPGPVELVQLALHVAQLPPEPELLDAVRTSSRLAAGQVISVTFAESHPRCLYLRSLCAGLLATAVGYHGPVADWQAYQPRWYPDQSSSPWFPVDLTVKPLRFVGVAAEQVPTTRPFDFWPVFERPVVPANSLVALAEVFARSLAARAKEQVRARVLPLPVFDLQEPRLYDFVLESVPVPLATTVLFTLRQAGAQAPLDVVGWEEEIPPITDERELLRFLGHVARAIRTRHAVERLLLLVPEAS